MRRRMVSEVGHLRLVHAAIAAINGRTVATGQRPHLRDIP